MTCGRAPFNRARTRIVTVASVSTDGPPFTVVTNGPLRTDGQETTGYRHGRIRFDGRLTGNGSDERSGADWWSEDHGAVPRQRDGRFTVHGRVADGYTPDYTYRGDGYGGDAPRDSHGQLRFDGRPTFYGDDGRSGTVQ